MTYQIIISLILSVAFGAISDGLNERGNKDWGHPAEAVEKVFLLLSAVLWGSWLVIIAYIAFRIALFDLIKNIAKGDPILYFGDSCAWDRFLGKQQPAGVVFGRIIFLAFAICFTIIEANGI